MSSKSYRNAMFLIADDWSRLAACYGNEAIHTPRIDQLAAKGIVFDWAFCTSPSCAVSRACILTGQHSHTHGQYGHCHGIQGFSTHRHLSSTVKDLRAQGFATACLGKKHVAPDSVYPFEFEPPVNARSVADLAEQARQFFKNNVDRPFYLHVGFTDPHRAGQGFANEPTYRDVVEHPYRPDEVIVPPFLPDIPAVRQDLAEYYQAVSRFDYGVGLLLDVLEESGRADDTLVILTTDHAMPFPGAKASFFDSGHHCPFILYAPDLASGDYHHQAMINWTNIRPTVQEWCGVNVSADLPERSLLPILETPVVEGWDEVFFSHCFHEVIDYNPYRVLRGRRYKYVQNLAADHQPPLPTDLFRSISWTAIREQEIGYMGRRTTEHVLKRSPEELYDLEQDPCETRNLIDQPDLQPLIAEMRQKLFAFRQETQDPWLELDFQAGRLTEEML